MWRCHRIRRKSKPRQLGSRAIISCKRYLTHGSRRSGIVVGKGGAYRLLLPIIKPLHISSHFQSCVVCKLPALARLLQIWTSFNIISYRSPPSHEAKHPPLSEQSILFLFLLDTSPLQSAAILPRRLSNTRRTNNWILVDHESHSTPY